MTESRGEALIAQWSRIERELLARAEQAERERDEAREAEGFRLAAEATPDAHDELAAKLERVQQASVAFHDRYHAAVHGSAPFPGCDCELAKVLREVGK